MVLVKFNVRPIHCLVYQVLLHTWTYKYNSECDYFFQMICLIDFHTKCHLISPADQWFWMVH
jgi:hypothetical protein